MKESLTPFSSTEFFTPSDGPASHRRRWIVVGLLASAAILSNCGGGAREVTSDSIAQDETPIEMFAEQDQPNSEEPFVSVLDIHIDPLAKDLPQTEQILDVVYATEKVFEIEPGTAVILYGSNQDSVNWTVAKTQELGCLDTQSKEDIAFGVGIGAACGFLMRVDAMSLECVGGSFCKTGLNTGAHELYHTVFDQKLQACGCSLLPNGDFVPTWIVEGFADYVGYALVYGTDLVVIEKSWSDLMDRANQPDVDRGLTAMEPLWGSLMGTSSFQYLYDRAYFAVSLLVQKYGEHKVFVELLDRVIATGDYRTAFQQTFGVPEEEFDAEFQRWVTSPSPVELVSVDSPPISPRTTTSTVTNPPGAIFTGFLGGLESVADRLIGLRWQLDGGSNPILLATGRTDANGAISIELPAEFHKNAPYGEDGGYCLVLDFNNDGQFTDVGPEVNDRAINCYQNISFGSTLTLPPPFMQSYK